MIAGLALMSAAPAISVPDPATWSVEQKIDYLAAGQARFAEPVSSALYDNPEVRAEIRRVGFLKGCQLVSQARKDVLAVHFSTLKAGYTAAIRKTVDENMLKAARFLSFNASPLTRASFRLRRESERSLAPEFAAIRIELSKRFFEISSPLPTETDPAANRIKPKADIAGAMGIAGDYDLDNPGYLGLACAEALIDPKYRPHISGGSE